MALVIDDTLISNQAENLRAALSTDPKMRKVIQHHIREALHEARREMIANSPIKSDPRHSMASIRTAVYDKILGGNINILNRKKASSGINSYKQPRTLRPGQRGGNRMKRSDRTQAILEYPPADRGFILRFVNSGTKTRVIGFRNTVKSNRNRYDSLVSRIHSGDTSRTGNRGSIAARNWFMQAAESALSQAAANIAEMVAIEAEAVARGEK